MRDVILRGRSATKEYFRDERLYRESVDPFISEARARARKWSSNRSILYENKGAPLAARSRCILPIYLSRRETPEKTRRVGDPPDRLGAPFGVSGLFLIRFYTCEWCLYFCGSWRPLISLRARSLVEKRATSRTRRHIFLGYLRANDSRAAHLERDPSSLL